MYTTQCYGIVQLREFIEFAALSCASGAAATTDVTVQQHTQ
jgi:hypothetical protein